MLRAPLSKADERQWRPILQYPRARAPLRVSASRTAGSAHITRTLLEACEVSLPIRRVPTANPRTRPWPFGTLIMENNLGFRCDVSTSPTVLLQFPHRSH